jgi:ATP-dependent helicase/nuclease subunit A
MKSEICMESPRQKKNSLTAAQQRAVESRGNVLVMAGAGTGKTHTLVERCLNLICDEQVSLDEILVVTFTEAAATEMRQRLHAALQVAINSRPSTLNLFLAEQLALFDAAHIGTLHGFCFKLVREHFYELGLDPQPAILDEGEARLLADETLDELLLEQYEGGDEFAGSVQRLISVYGGGRDENIRKLVLRLHHYAQTRPDADGWFARQIENFSATEPAVWRTWLLEAIGNWRAEWLPVLEQLSGNEKAIELAGILSGLGGAGVAPDFASNKGVGRDARHNRPEAWSTRISREAAAGVLKQIISADGGWPAKRKTTLRKLVEDFFDEAKFLLPLATIKNGNDPLAEDWNWVRGHMTALLRLARDFGMRFSDRKRADGVLDFHDLEQFALKLLWNFETGGPTDIARRWRGKLRFVFVDEYQDINAAQDRIIQALSRDHLECCDVSPLSTTRHIASDQSADVSAHSKANRFLVGDVKQSIYRFRLADPKIFRDYAKNWRGKDGQTIPLAENFRSRETLLSFVNSVFEPLMRAEIGGVNYDDEAKLKFGRRWGETPGEPNRNDIHTPPTAREDAHPTNIEPRAELLLRFNTGRGEEPSGGENGNELADLEESEKEARLLALRLKELEKEGHKIWDDEEKVFRAAKWRDMAVLLRSPSGKAEIFARQFERAGVPLAVARGGFFEGTEIQDLLSLLELLDNPLQDVPCIAVLRSPLVGCSLDELAEIRLAVKGVHFWTALATVERGWPAREVAHHADEPSALLLHNKISTFLERFSRWRKLARQASLSQCLDEILAETHYGDWLRSQPRGAQRRANAEQFLNLAQKFDQFQRQGLFRFLKFIEAQREAGAEPDSAPAAEENAVRLMSIHQSKGQEFPVVAIADLAKPFNTQDLRDDIILDEEYGLCPRVKPPDRGGRYPSLTHWLAQRCQRRELLGEELRLLYVAMTRARDTLILTGGIAEKKWETLWTKPAAITPQKIAGAKSVADWLGMWFANQVHSPEAGVQNCEEGDLPHLRWRLVADAELAEKADSEKREAEMELPALDGATAERLRAMLLREYPHSAATRRAAKSSVTALRRLAGETDGEAEPIFAPKFSGKRLAWTPAPPVQKRKAESGKRKLSAAETGTAHHKFLQHVALEKTGSGAALKAEAERMEREKILSADERTALEVEALADFWNSETGATIRKHGAYVKRELAFTARFSPVELAEIASMKAEAGPENEFVVVQGVVDLAVLLPKEIWLVDFKTDAIRVKELSEKTRIYAPQLKLYAAALAKIYSRPATQCRLHFLSARKTVDI